MEETAQKLGIEDGISTPDAITYIKDSSICTDPKHGWLLPLIEKVLDDSLEEVDVTAFVLGKEPAPKAVTTHDITKSLTYVVVPQDIRKISSIEKISNAGLVNIIEPLPIEEGLNVFYGGNGVGKSTIYHALCKVFGKDKRLLPNIEGESEESLCVLKYKDGSDSEQTLSWKTGDKNTDSRVVIFDGQISQTLIENDQNNKFEIAHLNLQYFRYLRELYDRAESALDGAASTTSSAIAELEESLKESVPDLVGADSEDIKTTIADNSFSKSEKDELKNIQKKIELLKKENPEAIVKNLRTAQSAAQEVLSIFGEQDYEDKWHFAYTNRDFFQPTNTKVKAYNAAKKAFEQGGQSKIAALLPEEWINTPTWNEFIQKSVEFVETLDEHSQHKYQSETCPYCQQALETPASKKLVRAYADLTAEHEQKLTVTKKEIEQVTDYVSAHLANLKGIKKLNAAIEAEFSLVGKRGGIDVNSQRITGILQSIKKSLEGNAEITISDEDYDALSSFYLEYVAIDTLFGKKIREIETALLNKQRSITTLEQQASPLLTAKAIASQKKTLKAYWARLEERAAIKIKQDSIHGLKQATSRLESEFAKVAGLKEFKKCLDEEYAYLRFTPPASWTLRPITRDGINRRAYSLNERRLAEIFSEGERKLHSLADFFAQCETNKYKGIYIFDDPVNSLDEENIESVAARILKLVEDGNQVIVFTHNIFFLNELVEHSKTKINEVTKSGGQVILEVGVDKDERSEMKKVMKRIDARMKELENKTALGWDDVAHIYDYISRYLEYYVEQILLRNIIHRHRSNIRMDSLTSLALDPTLVQQVSALYRKTSRKGIRHSQPSGVQLPTYDELKADVEFLQTSLGYN